jgi:uncharacterized membrane protein
MRGRRYAGGFLAAVVGLSALATDAAATTLHACNRTDEKIYIAAAGFDIASRSLEWRSVGWYQLDAGACEDFWLNKLMPQHLFLNANSQSNELNWTGNFLFCVNQRDPFDLKGDRNCAGFGEGFAVRRFFHKRSADGEFTVNFTR